ncbi:DsbC family protein [Noviherbaspirillum pedocola]|uniref:Thiol:disulfide interchange protein n=1 Tax=Noviherbaspirillum pedocola TaxID=2801341 RepID=A0A934W3W6_9BURK|nr:DsbC family protein [Noviherbaspirillum pedocola]MBK4737876.1 DsbC family protein [Noviherbaspirillum pedocola]
MKKTLLTLALAASALTSFAAQPAMDPEAAQVLMKLKQSYPSTTFGNIEKSQLPGVFEVTMGKNIAYTDKDGRYFLFGSVYDMQTRQDLTAPKREALNKIDVSKLPLADAIVTKRGNGARTIYLFSDPDCPFCKRLEPELAKVDNVTIYTFLFPIDSLHPDARNKAESIWCSKDRSASWSSAMITGQLPESKKCANPVERNVALAEKLNIRGTPYLMSADGRSLPGAAPAEKINAWLEGSM